MLNDREGATDRPLSGGRVLVFGLVLVCVTAAVGAVLPSQTGLEEVVVLEITFAVSPVAFAPYGGVAVGTFLVTLLFVVEIISKFDDGTL